MRKINRVSGIKLFSLFVLPALLWANAGSASAAGVPALQQTLDGHSLQITNLNNQISVLNSSVGQLAVDNSNQNVALDSISSSLQSQGITIQNLNDNYNSLNVKVDTLETSLLTLEGKFNQLSDKVDSLIITPPTDFSFFTNHPFKYGGYFMSPAFDAKDYTKFSMSFTCTSHSNDELKYWIETSADGTNWSPWGYYHVRCNGIYGGASINAGQMPARYFAIAVQQISNTNNTNTITSVGRFSN